jgi:hypothetical protein
MISNATVLNVKCVAKSRSSDLRDLKRTTLLSVPIAGFLSYEEVVKNSVGHSTGRRSLSPPEAAPTGSDVGASACY